MDLPQAKRDERSFDRAPALCDPFVQALCHPSRATVQSDVLLRPAFTVFSQLFCLVRSGSWSPSRGTTFRRGDPTAAGEILVPFEEKLLHAIAQCGFPGRKGLDKPHHIERAPHILLVSVPGEKSLLPRRNRLLIRLCLTFPGRDASVLGRMEFRLIRERLDRLEDRPGCAEFGLAIAERPPRCTEILFLVVEAIGVAFCVVDLVFPPQQMLVPAIERGPPRICGGLLCVEGRIQQSPAPLFPCRTTRSGQLEILLPLHRLQRVDVDAGSLDLGRFLLEILGLVAQLRLATPQLLHGLHAPQGLK